MTHVPPSQLGSTFPLLPAVDPSSHDTRSSRQSPPAFSDPTSAYSVNTWWFIHQFRQCLERFPDVSYGEIIHHKHNLQERQKIEMLSPHEKRAIESLLDQFHTLSQAHVLFGSMKTMSSILKKQNQHQSLSLEEKELLRRFRFFLSKLPGRTKEERFSLKQRIWTAYLQAQPLSHRHITWIHGSQSQAIPLMKRVKEALCMPSLALIPTGRLLQHNFAPLSGELIYGVTRGGVNQASLSGMDLTGVETAARYTVGSSPLRVRERLQHLREIIQEVGLTPLRILVLQYLQLRPIDPSFEEMKKLIASFCNEMLEKEQANPMRTRGWYLLPGQRTQAQSIDCRPLGSKEPLHLHQVVLVGQGEKRAFGIVKEWEEKQQVGLIQLHLDGYSDRLPASHIFLPTEPLSPHEYPQFEANIQKLHQDIHDLMTLFDIIAPLDLSEEEQLLFLEHPFPIIWASCTLRPAHFSGGVFQEKVVETQAACLGEDIQLAFTDHEHIITLRKELYRYGVEVVDMDAAMLLSAFPELIPKETPPSPSHPPLLRRRTTEIVPD